MIALWTTLACSSEPELQIPVEPQPIGLSECAVCGMTVAEQPSPRGQVQHREGEHLHFCSLGDLRAYLAAPSPLGSPVGVWVEVLPAELDPALRDSSEQTWLAAEQASYIQGVPRKAVMGEPLLSYPDSATAEAAQQAWGGEPTSWESLRAAGF